MLLAAAASVAVPFVAVPSAATPLKLPDGMGGVPDIGAIPCIVLTEMMVIGPKGTRLSLLTWAEGYYYAKSGKSLDEILESRPAGEQNDFFGLTDHLVDYCAENPEAITREAVADLGAKLLT
jgi:hypothetical protein